MVKILTDSGADLNTELCVDYNIDVMPLTVHLADQVLADQIDISPEKLMDYIRQGEMPKTSQVSPDTMASTFESLSLENEEVLYITFSSELSGTYNTAKMVLKELQDGGIGKNIKIVDSKCASLGQGLVVLKAAELAKTNASMETILNKLELNMSKVQHHFTVSDLTHLYNGGRVSKSQAYIGNILNISPIMTIEEGRIVVKDKIRGKRKSYNKLIDKLKQSKVDMNRCSIGIAHSCDQESVKYLIDKIRTLGEPKRLVVNHVGCAIGAHTGPSLLSVYCLEEDLVD